MPFALVVFGGLASIGDSLSTARAEVPGGTCRRHLEASIALVNGKGTFWVPSVPTFPDGDPPWPGPCSATSTPSCQAPARDLCPASNHVWKDQPAHATGWRHRDGLPPKRHVVGLWRFQES